MRIALGGALSICAPRFRFFISLSFFSCIFRVRSASIVSNSLLAATGRRDLTILFREDCNDTCKLDCLGNLERNRVFVKYDEQIMSTLC